MRKTDKMRVEVNPDLLRWACERAGLNTQIVARRMPQLTDWEDGKIKPTLKQIERFAKIVHAPVGYLFLTTPPIEDIPIPDFRTIENIHIGHPSPDLLETIYLCQQRQEWYRDYSRSIRQTPCPFVGSAVLDNDVITVAGSIRHTLGFDIEARRRLSTWEDALRQFVSQADEAGVLVMVNGVVGSNNRRKLDHEEFRGFALSDDIAPLIFINGADTKSAQMFTLAHELAHIWLGKTGLSDVGPTTFPSNVIETWCDRVAAEILVPLNALQNEYRRNNDLPKETERLARYFKVSTLVILRRIHDAGYITKDYFRVAYKEELDRLLAIIRSSGGNFYLTQAARISKRFARALIINTLEGQTLHRDAFQLLGFSKIATFRELGSRLGVI
jgi:Zn-dependent peptidase ImmA (M78 family)